MKCSVFYILCTTLIIFIYYNILQNDKVKNCYATYTFRLIFFETVLKFLYAIRNALGHHINTTFHKIRYATYSILNTENSGLGTEY